MTTIAAASSAKTINNLPDVILFERCATLSNIRARNSLSLVNRKFLALERSTRYSLTLRGNAQDLFLVPSCFRSGILGFYRNVTSVIVGSTASSTVYFGTCEFGKSILFKLEDFPPLLVPPTAGAMGNIVSSTIMVPKEVITQRMQAGVKGRSWEVLLKIFGNDGVLGLYAGYFATLLRNFPAGVLSYLSFEYLKAAVLSKAKKAQMQPIESVVCGALAGAISASFTTPLML
ncbi:Protein MITOFERRINLIKE 1, chloroplastic [Linum perenne]